MPTTVPTTVPTSVPTSGGPLTSGPERTAEMPDRTPEMPDRTPAMPDRTPAMTDRTPAMTGLADRLRWDVGDSELLVRSLSHRSWCAEEPGSISNERLEFLGGARLSIKVTDFL